MWRSSTLFLAALIAVISATLAISCSTSQDTLTLATTTSTADSGLLDFLLPQFEEETGSEIQVLAVGTGEALELGRRGDADIILVHDRQREDEFVAQGFGVQRQDVMYNDFVVVGPEDDPAQASDASDVMEAFRRIAQAGASGGAAFVSRGDQSGTHGKEMGIWSEAGISPEGDWYNETGQGMGETLIIAHELGAYTLADRGTYLSMTSRVSLAVLVEGEEILNNPYGIIAVNPERFSHVNHDLAVELIDYLTRLDTQERIADFGMEEFGQPLFYPDSAQWRAEHQTSSP